MFKSHELSKDNRAFSLVELIVVIAIMVVLVAVLAPTFTKYVEESKRATDIQNATSIARAVNTDVADGKIEDTGDNKVDVVAGNPTSIKSTVKTKGHAVAADRNFQYSYNESDNSVHVYVDGCSYDLADTEYDLQYKSTKLTANGAWDEKKD